MVVLWMLYTAALATVVVLTSTRTPESHLKALSLFATEVAVVHLDQDVTSHELNALEPSWVLDFTNSPDLSQSLRQGSRANAHWINGNSYIVEGEEWLFGPSLNEIEALATVAKSLRMTRPCLFLTPETLWAREVFVRSVFPIEVTSFALSKELFPGSLSTFIRKEVKGKGLLNLIIILPSSLALVLLETLRDDHMEKSPLMLLLSQDAARARSSPMYPTLAKTGTLFLSAPGYENSTGDADITYYRLKERFNATAVFSVVGLQNGTEYLLGTTASAASLCVDCFIPRPGWSAVLSRSPLQVSFNNGTLNPNGDTNSGERQWYLGAQLALMDVNADSTLLPDHYLRFFNMSLGLNIFNATWALKQAEKYSKEDYGLAFMHSQYSTMAVPLYDLLVSNLSLTVPQVAGTVLTPTLSSTKRYPYFSRVVVSTDYFAVLYVKQIQYYGWKRLAVTYCDDIACGELYDAFIRSAEKAGLTIVNPPESRRFPSKMTKYPTDRLTDYQQIVDSKVRVVLMIVYGSLLFYSLDVFYDLGARRGDLFFLATTWLTPTVFTTGTEQSRVKRRELLAGAVQCYPVGFYGSYGRAVERHFVETFHVQPANRACLYYDELLSIAHAVNDLIVEGKDYEDHWTLAKALKSVRFMGCSGEVSMQEGTNDRSPMRFQITNALVFEDGSVQIVETGIYDPVGVVMFNFTRDIVWPDNTTTVPTDTRISLIDCPFDEKDVVTFKPGVAVAYSVLFSVTLIAILITASIWRWHWRLFPAKRLESKVEISFDDYVLFTTIALEAFQYAEMGPPFPASLVFISIASKALNWNLELFLYMRNGMYWIVLDVALGCVIAWVPFVVLAKTSWGEILIRKVPLLDAICEKVLPILGNLCFLPIISTLLNIYQCVEAVDTGGDIGFTNTFMHKDCYQTCWKFPHTVYAVCALVALLCYVPSAVYFRPIWQDFQPSLHVFATPVHLMIKSIYQLLLVAGSKVLHDYHSLGHCSFFICVTVAYFSTSWKWRPFGYSRANLWNDISLVCVLWLALVAFVNLLNSYIPVIVYMGVFLGGVTCAVVFGLLYQHFRLPALLHRSKGIHVMNLFRFQFSRGSKLLYMFATRRAQQEREEDLERPQAAPDPPILEVYTISQLLPVN